MKLWSKRGNSMREKNFKFNIAGMDKRFVIALVAVVAVILVSSVALAIATFSYDKVFAGVRVGGEKVSGMTQAEVEDLVKSKSTDEYRSVAFDIKVAKNIEHITADRLKAHRDSALAAQAAFNVGREGSAIRRMLVVFSSVFKKRDIPLTVVLDEAELNALIAKVCEENNIPAVDAAYKIDGKKMTVTPAVDGVAVDEKALREQILERFNSDSYEDIVMSTQVAQAKKLDMDEVYAQVHTQVADAYMTDEGGAHKIVPHVVGIDFDLEAAREKLAANPDSTFEIPLKVTNPKVTTMMLESSLFKDVLGKATSYYNPNKVSRTHNVTLAAKLINGKVLNPGEVFSYNETVGPRTRARGFKEASVFSGGEIVDGLGGGICQVSSTLYMSALQADMKTVSRKNHSFYVDYAPKGQDATVVYGSIDYKFENSSPYPIKILTSQTKNGYLTVKIMGTKTADKTVKITTKVLSTKPFTEKIINDSKLKPGQRVVEQKGQEGITMDVYRNVYDANGKLITSYKENSTRYIPLTQIVRVGPAVSDAVAPTPTVPEKDQTPTPEPQPTPEPTTPQPEQTPPETTTTPVEPQPTPDPQPEPENQEQPAPEQETPAEEAPQE